MVNVFVALEAETLWREKEFEKFSQGLKKLRRDPLEFSTLILSQSIDNIEGEKWGKGEHYDTCPAEVESYHLV